MSSNLTAEPINRKKLDLSTAIKFAFRKRFGEPVNITLCESDFTFLDGMLAAANDDLAKDINNLIEYINKHGMVLIKEEY